MRVLFYVARFSGIQFAIGQFVDFDPNVEPVLQNSLIFLLFQDLGLNQGPGARLPWSCLSLLPVLCRSCSRAQPSTSFTGPSGFYSLEVAFVGFFIANFCMASNLCFTDGFLRLPDILASFDALWKKLRRYWLLAVPEQNLGNFGKFFRARRALGESETACQSCRNEKQNPKYKFIKSLDSARMNQI